MLRYRRYRVFLLAAAVTTFLFFRLNQPSRWQSSTPNVGSLKEHLGQFGLHREAGSESAEHNVATHNNQGPDANESSDRIRPPTSPTSVPKPIQKIPPNRPPPKAKPTATRGTLKIDDGEDGIRAIPGPPADDAMEVILAEGGEGRWPQDHLPPQVPDVRWSKLPEHYPVPTESVKQLPTGALKKIPKIQHKFGKKSAEAEKERQQKLAVIKEAFSHAWNGYKGEAWGKDELLPVSGGSKNTFNGWAATLVDSLDTMWIMGLEGEFEEALEFVKNIDFQTSARPNIPLFETTIRYLGGLLGAYDVSGGKYKVLLDKAEELGEVLMGAFDTPNRMPLTYYHWRPAFASQPHRAPARVVLAEIGSLQMEFTRLSQLTQNSKYYDAVARIIDELDVWQNHTSLPGFWPADIDTTGCARNRGGYSTSRDSEDTLGHVGVAPVTPDMEPLKKPNPVTFNKVDRPFMDVKAAQDKEKPADPTPVVTENPRTDEPADKMVPLDKPNPVLFSIKEPASTKFKRQLDSVETVPVPNLAFAARDAPIMDKGNIECAPAGLDTATTSSEKFTLGSTADSAFEYLSKQYLLLGGRIDQYRSMYETALNVANEKLLFRVMIPDEKREILVSGNYRLSPYSQSGELEKLQPKGEHLTCFVGGMFAMGAKMFNRPDDLEIAAKLTDGCVWAYESTVTGIMPETFDAVPCESRKSCAWNETKWWEYLDPTAEMRQEMYDQEMETYRSETAAAAAAAAAAASAAKAPPTPPASGAHATVTQAQDSARSPPKGPIVQHEPDADRHEHNKRQVGGQPDNQGNPAHSDDDTKPSSTTESEPETEFQPPSISADAPPSIYSPTKPMTREEFAKLRIEGENLPPGMNQVDARYLLRPEALESVFYMHRITGEPYWRAQGWKMISAILKHTRTPLGHSAILNVNSATPGFDNSMESFWLAETLKYAYLLFDDEENWSLDDWVLNTEAHLFRRPDAGKS